MTTVLITTPSISVLRAGIPGPGVPTNGTEGQIPVATINGDWVPTTVLSGLTQIAVVAALPDPQVTGTLYFVPGPYTL